jgi:RIP metalloprotease RseP
MAGEDAQTEEDQQVPQDRLFNTKPPLSRIAIIVAGPVANIIFAVILMIIYISSFGVPFVEVGEVNPGSHIMGVLQSGDKIKQLNGEDIYFSDQIQSIVQKAKENPIPAVIDRAGKDLNVTIQPYYDKSVSRYVIGIFFNFPTNKIALLPQDASFVKQGILKEDDIVLAVNGTPTPSSPEVTAAMDDALAQGIPINLKIQRGQVVLPEAQIDPASTTKEEIDKIQGLSLGITSTLPVVERVAKDSFMYQQGLRAGDVLVSADGNPVSTITSLLRAVLTAQATSGSMTLIVNRNGQPQSLALDVSEKDFVDVLQGMQLKSAQRKPAGVFASIFIGFKRILDTINLLYQGILNVIRGQVSAGEAFRGPVGIANILGVSIMQGFDRFFQLVALLSLVLGIFNLVPFPALDGSRILFIFVELVRGRPIPPEKEGWVHYVGFIFLMGLILIITWQDIQRLFRGGL